MGIVTDIERELLELPAAERERIVVKAWASLASDPEVAADSEVDPEGIRIAESRDKEIEDRRISPIDQNEFRRLTGDD